MGRKINLMPSSRRAHAKARLRKSAPLSECTVSGSPAAGHDKLPSSLDRALLDHIHILRSGRLYGLSTKLDPEDWRNLVNAERARRDLPNRRHRRSGFVSSRTQCSPSTLRARSARPRRKTTFNLMRRSSKASKGLL